MLTSLMYSGVKGQSLTTELAKVNLITGENGTGKTSVLSAIQLALGQGVTDVGKSNAALGLLLSDTGRCCSIVNLDNGGSYETNVSRKKSTISVSQNPPIDKDLFGGVPQVTEDFFGLSGDEKWKLIMKAARKNKDAANLDAATRKKFKISDDDIVGSIMKAIDELKAQKKSETIHLDEARARLSVSPPVCNVENIQEVNRRVSECKAVITSHFTSKQRAERRERNKAGYEKEITSLDAQLEKFQSDLESWQKVLKENTDRHSELTATMESDEYKQKLEKSTVNRNLRTALDCIKLVIDEHQKSSNQAKNEIGIDLEKIVESLKFLIDSFSYDEATSNADDLYDLHICESNIHLTKKNIDRTISDIDVAKTKKEKLNDQYQSLLSEELVMMSEESLSEISKEIETLEAKQGEFTRLEQYNKNQKEDMELVNEISAKIEAINEEISKLNEVREKIIDRTIPVIEREANKILRDVGLGEVVVKTESTASRVSLVIEDKNGVDMRTICRSRKVIYGSALLYAFHKVCEVELSVIYVEAAELSKKYLYLFLESINNNCEGTTFLVGHWAVPELKLSEDIKVVELV